MARVANREKRIEQVRKRIVSVREAEPYVKLLVYGRNGAGKTRLAASGPAPLVVDINEKGTKSVRNYPGVKVFHVAKWEDLTYLFWFLHEGDHQYETVVLDTLTGLQNLCMKHVLKEGVDRDPNRDPAMPAQRDWGKMSELIKPLLLNYRNLPMHVVFTAQERLVGDDDGNQEHTPDLSASIRAVACGSVDIIGRIYQAQVRQVNKRTKKEVKAWETRLLVGPHDEYTTKDRTGNLGRILTQPTMEKIIDAATTEDADG